VGGVCAVWASMHAAASVSPSCCATYSAGGVEGARRRVRVRVRLLGIWWLRALCWLGSVPAHVWEGGRTPQRFAPCGYTPLVLSSCVVAGGTYWLAPCCCKEARSVGAARKCAAGQCTWRAYIAVALTHRHSPPPSPPMPGTSRLVLTPEINCYCELYACNLEAPAFEGKDIRGFILSGGPSSVYEEGAPHVKDSLWALIAERTWGRRAKHA
jgi:hypothetical protein